MGILDSFIEHTRKETRGIPQEVQSLSAQLGALLDSKKNQIEQLFSEDEVLVLCDIELKLAELGFSLSWSLGWYLSPERQVLGQGAVVDIYPNARCAESTLLKLQEKLQEVSAALERELATLKNKLSQENPPK